MAEKIEAGSIVEGKVIRVKPFGAIVQLENGTQGLVHISQVANGFVQDINEHVAVDDTVKVKVISVDEENNKIALSIREALPKAPRQQRQQNFKPREHKNNYEPRGTKQHSNNEAQQPKEPVNDFEEKMKEWLKQSNERQAGINKRNNRRNGGY